MSVHYSTGVPPPTQRPTMNGYHSLTNGHHHLTNGHHHLTNGMASMSLNATNGTNGFTSDQNENRQRPNFIRNTPFCSICRSEFRSQSDLTAHKLSQQHSFQLLKCQYGNQRDELIRDKHNVEVTVSSKLLMCDGVTPAVSEIYIHLDEEAPSDVRLRNCYKLINLEDVTISHPALKNAQSIVVSPGETVTVRVEFLTTIPTDILVPFGLRMTTEETNPLQFFIVCELYFYYAIENLTHETEMGKMSYDFEYHRGSYAPLLKLYEGERVRSNNTPELPLPIMKDRFDIPEKLQPISDYLLKIRNNGNATLDELSQQYYKEILRLLRQPVTVDNYFLKFDCMLYFEEMSKKAQLLSQNLAKIQLHRDAHSFFHVILYGLPENKPPINVGYRIFVRETPDSNSAYEGTITSIENRTAQFRMPVQFERHFKAEHKYSIEFQFNRRVYLVLHTAVKGVADKVMAGGGNSCIFPRHQQITRPIPLMTGNDLNRMKFFDANIENNPEQLETVRSILRGDHRPAPFILFGPPGTGKSSTLAEAIKQILTFQRTARVLVCASSNSACDVMCEKLLKDIDPRKMLRMYASSFNVAKISPIIKEYECHNFVTGTVDFPGLKTLQNYQVLITTLATSFRFSEIESGFITHVFIDECGFSMEPESLIPIYSCLRNWKASDERKPGGHLILAGDIKQLGPVLASTMCQNYLSISLMERLMNDINAPYQKPYNSTYIVKLLRNYRSHEHILNIPNQLFYDGDLQPYADREVKNTFIDWAELPNKKMPLIMHNCIAEERRDTHSTSYYNITEIDVVIRYIKLILQKHISQSDIGVITPYIAQGRRIRNALASRHMSDIKVGTVEEFQGQERLVIIISTVRNCQDLLQRDLLQRLGFLKNPKRFNVALTRAKALLVCVGNASILMRDKSWAHFIQFAKVNNAWAGVSSEEVVLAHDIISQTIAQ